VCACTRRRCRRLCGRRSRRRRRASVSPTSCVTPTHTTYTHEDDVEDDTQRRDIDGDDTQTRVFDVMCVFVNDLVNGVCVVDFVCANIVDTHDEDTHARRHRSRQTRRQTQMRYIDVDDTHTNTCVVNDVFARVVDVIVGCVIIVSVCRRRPRRCVLSYVVVHTHAPDYVEDEYDDNDDTHTLCIRHTYTHIHKWRRQRQTHDDAGDDAHTCRWRHAHMTTAYVVVVVAYTNPTMTKQTHEKYVDADDTHENDVDANDTHATMTLTPLTHTTHRYTGRRRRRHKHNDVIACHRCHHRVCVCVCVWSSTSLCVCVCVVVVCHYRKSTSWLSLDYMTLYAILHILTCFSSLSRWMPGQNLEIGQPHFILYNFQFTAPEL
jgi:hypothetical protein